jgi:PPOX class probable F420-dependent enzyme
LATAVPESHRDILSKLGFAHAATIGPRGEPHSSPVWYEWDGAHLLFSHTKSRQKYRNLMRDPRISLSITDPDDPYRSVEIRGSARITDDPEGSLIHHLAHRYRGVECYEGELEGRVVVEVAPERVTTWG